MQSGIESKCSGAQLAALNGMSAFGGGCNVAAAGMNVAGFASCEVTAHDGQGDALIDLLQAVGPKSQPSFTVPAGTVRLRVTLNALDAGANDFDLFIRQGAAPTTSTFTAKSDNYGVWEGIDVASPPTGTWYALVAPFGGDAGAPFQLTITTFNP